MSELLPCPFCDEPLIGITWKHLGGDTSKDITRYAHAYNPNIQCFVSERVVSIGKKDIELWNTRHSKYPLAPVSSTLDRLLDSRFDLAAEAEADLGEIEHNGEKVMVKIKVVREVR